ncbi:MAG: hypothetical protein ACRBDL_10815 [Alphaproteobacteria bacterium]
MAINGISNIFDDVKDGYSTMGAPAIGAQFSQMASTTDLGFGNNGTTLEHDGMHV